MVNYEEARVKLINTQTNKLKSPTKNSTGTTLRIIKKNFQDNELPHALLLTTRQKTKIRNAFVNNMLSVIRLSKSQSANLIRSWRFLGKTLG